MKPSTKAVSGDLPSPRPELRIDAERLLGRIEALGRIGALPGGGVSRLALTDADREARDLVVRWMRELGLAVTVDRVGNIVGRRAGRSDGPPVLLGSHIDTVATGGLYDGNLGVLGALEVVETLNDAGVETDRPLAVAVFTNEEGSRFAPDMLGSYVFQGGLAIEEALDTIGIDGARFGDELERIGYAGDAEPGFDVHAYVELHIEQGPVLEAEGITIGAVEGVQGISWTEYTVEGVSNHAGTTPMRFRHDAGYVAGAIASFVRELVREMGGAQVGTVGRIELDPNLVNVIARKAVLTVDLRNTDEERLKQAEARLADRVARLAAAEGVRIHGRRLARFEPVPFAPEMIDLVEATARELGHTVRRLPSGAGHDAQMLAPLCPTGMVFVPSVEGKSHNTAEETRPEHVEAGANVLLQLALKLTA